MLKSLLLLMLEIRPHLRGAFDLVFLFGRGIKAFDPSIPAMLRSFWWLVLLYPVLVISALAYPPKGLEDAAVLQVITNVTIQHFFSYAAFLAVMVPLSRALSVKQNLPLFITALNWVSVAATIITLPFFVAAVLEWFPRTEMDRIFVIIQCYFYIVTGCIARRALNIGWEFAGMIAVVSLFMGQTAWDILFLLQDIPDPWEW